MTIMKRKTTKRKSIRRTKMPSWNEVRMGLTQVSKLRLLFLLAKIYRSSVVPRSVKLNILSMAKTGFAKAPEKIRLKKFMKKYYEKDGKTMKIVKPQINGRRKKPRSAAQKRATRKLVALNKRRQR